MPRSRQYILLLLAIAVVFCAVIVVPVFAQEEEQEPETADAPEVEEIDPMEEIIVVSPRPGSRKRVDQEYEDPVRAKLLKDFYRMQELEEEYEWRTAKSSDSSSRIKLGYDPRDEYRMRSDTALQDLHFEKDKPATLFRVEF